MHICNLLVKDLFPIFSSEHPYMIVPPHDYLIPRSFTFDDKFPEFTGLDRSTGSNMRNIEDVLIPA
jgi:hypothetical protein